MADLGANGPLIASLLLGQRQEDNPFTAQRKYGRQLIVQGGATTPLQSGNPLEGLARALQAGVGGLAVGLANKEEEDQTQHNVGLMSDAAKVAITDPNKAAEILKGLKGSSGMSEALLGQIVQSGIGEGLKQQQAKGVYDRGGGTGGIEGGPGVTIDITKPNISAGGGYQPTLASRESGGNPQAVNPQSGAFGLYQFMPQTAADVRAADCRPPLVRGAETTPRRRRARPPASTAWRHPPR